MGYKAKQIIGATTQPKTIRVKRAYNSAPISPDKMDVIQAHFTVAKMGYMRVSKLFNLTESKLKGAGLKSVNNPVTKKVWVIEDNELKSHIISLTKKRAKQLNRAECDDNLTFQVDASDLTYRSIRDANKSVRTIKFIDGIIKLYALMVKGVFNNIKFVPEYGVKRAGEKSIHFDALISQHIDTIKENAQGEIIGYADTNAKFENAEAEGITIIHPKKTVKKPHLEVETVFGDFKDLLHKHEALLTVLDEDKKPVMSIAEALPILHLIKKLTIDKTPATLEELNLLKPRVLITLTTPAL